MVKRPFYLAQLNVARARAPIDSPVMLGFASQLESIYAATERAEGFVWRLRADDAQRLGHLAAAEDPRMFVTLSVWESVEALRAYVYASQHKAPLQNRAEWFDKHDGPNLVLWWIRRGSLPRVEQGLGRLKYLQRHGPSPLAFTFKDWFPGPDG